MLSSSTISSDIGKYTVIIDDTNFMTASENSLGVWATIWPDFLYFSKNDDFDCFAFILYCDFVMVSLIVEPAQ